MHHGFVTKLMIVDCIIYIYSGSRIYGETYIYITKILKFTQKKKIIDFIQHQYIELHSIIIYNIRCNSTHT